MTTQKNDPKQAVNVIVNSSIIPWQFALTIAFFAAKVFDLITWSWWLVFLPLWIIPAVIVGGGAFVGGLWLLTMGIAVLLDKISYTKWGKKRSAKKREKRRLKQEKKNQEIREQWGARHSGE